MLWGIDDEEVENQYLLWWSSEWQGVFDKYEIIDEDDLQSYLNDEIRYLNDEISDEQEF